MEKIYLVMEMRPDFWDMPLGAYATEEMAKMQCRRLARMLEQQLKERMIEHLRNINSSQIEAEKPEHLSVQESSGESSEWEVALCQKNFNRDGSLHSDHPCVVYHVQSFVIGAQTKPFWGFRDDEKRGN